MEEEKTIILSTGTYTVGILIWSDGSVTRGLSTLVHNPGHVPIEYLELCRKRRFYDVELRTPVTLIDNNSSGRFICLNEIKTCSFDFENENLMVISGCLTSLSKSSREFLLSATKFSHPESCFLSFLEGPVSQALFEGAKVVYHVDADGKVKCKKNSLFVNKTKAVSIPITVLKVRKNTPIKELEPGWSYSTSWAGEELFRWALPEPNNTALYNSYFARSRENL